MMEKLIMEGKFLPTVSMQVRKCTGVTIIVITLIKAAQIIQPFLILLIPTLLDPCAAGKLP